MKKSVASIAALVLAAALTLAACGGKTVSDDKQNSSDISSSKTSNVEIPSPWVDVDDLDEAAKKAGFDITVPETIDGYAKRVVQVVDGETIQVIYQQDSEDGAQVTVRKSAESGDPSGDYNDYAEVSEVMTDDGRTVTLSGNDGQVSLAVWSDGEYSYSIGAYEGGAMNADAMLALVAQVA